MKRRLISLLFLGGIIFLVAGIASAKTQGSFFDDLEKHVAAISASRQGEFKTTYSHNANIDNPGPEDKCYTKVFRSKMTVIVKGDMDFGNKNPEYIAWFSTKDPSRSFHGVKVGGSIKKVIASQAIDLPEMEKGKNPDGRQWYSWSDEGGDLHVTLFTKGDVIQEIQFLNLSLPVGVDAVGKNWEKVGYLK